MYLSCYNVLFVMLCLSCFALIVLRCFHMILYFTQVNKVPARSLGMCLGEDVKVHMGYVFIASTFFH